MSEDAYDRDSLNRYLADIERVKRAPLAVRKENRDKFAASMRDEPEFVAERIDWMLDGNYGRGAELAGARVLAMGKNANKVATLNCMIGALEWLCPADMVVDGWKTLTKPQQEALDAAIRVVLRRRERAKYAAESITRVTTPHGRCKGSRTCVEHKYNPDVPSCKVRGKGRVS